MKKREEDIIEGEVKMFELVCVSVCVCVLPSSQNASHGI